MNIFSVKENVIEFTPVSEKGKAEPSRFDAAIAETTMEAEVMVLPARIIVIGVGGCGSNAVNRMIADGVEGVEFATINADLQDIRVKSLAKIKMQIGSKLTGGRGAGGNPEIGAAAANEDREELAGLMRGADMVFVTCGMGGGTGTGAGPIIAAIAKEQGILTVGAVTKPFAYEELTKKKIAEEGIARMRPSVDALVIIPNEQIFKVIDRKTPILEAYRIADSVLREGVQGITDLIIKTGLINTDFADVKATMSGQGDALMGVGMAKGDDRAEQAAKHAIDNPMLEDVCVDGATRMLVNISGPEDLAMVEVDEIMKIVKAKADKDVEIIHGVIIDPKLGDSIKVTVIATGFAGGLAGDASTAREKNEKKSDGFGDVIPHDRFQEMLGRKSGGFQAEGHSGSRPVRGSAPTQEDLSIPAYLRRSGSEPLSDRGRSFGGKGSSS
ncbi:MAG: cell division protein FtsZ [Treponema sp.]|nr:cell division protein FtsZ [Treponema sp.]